MLEISFDINCLYRKHSKTKDDAYKNLFHYFEILTVLPEFLFIYLTLLNNANICKKNVMNVIFIAIIAITLIKIAIVKCSIMNT